MLNLIMVIYFFVGFISFCGIDGITVKYGEYSSWWLDLLVMLLIIIFWPIFWVICFFKMF